MHLSMSSPRVGRAAPQEFDCDVCPQSPQGGDIILLIIHLQRAEDK